MKNSPELIDYNTDQLYKGLDSKSNRITPEYTPRTKDIKQAKGQPVDRVTLKDEGDFYDGFYVKQKKFPFSIDSTDQKTEALTDKYGNEIFGLTESNQKEYARKILLPYVQDDFKEAVSKAFRLLR